MGVRGYVSAYDAATGKLVWRFYTVPGDPDLGPDEAASDDALEKLAASTWSGREYFKHGGGGTVWDVTLPTETYTTKEELLAYHKLMFTMRRMEISCDIDYKVRLPHSRNPSL